MRIYQIMGSDISKAGGREKYVFELTGFLSGHGHPVKIICRNGSIYDGEKVHFTTGQNTEAKFSSTLFIMMQHLPNPKTTVFGIKRLIYEIKNEISNQYVIHVHDLSSSVIIGFVVSKILKIPMVVQIHGFPLREPLIKLKRTNSFTTFSVMLVTKIWHSIAVALVKYGSKVVLVNNSEVKSFYNSAGINDNILGVVPSAIDLRKHEGGMLPQKGALEYFKVEKPKNGLIIGYIGRLGPEKNLETLLEAFAIFSSQCPQFKSKLLIIGDGYIRSSLEKIIADHNLSEDVIITGLVPDAYKYLSAIEVFVLPSFTEGSPLSLIEAMAAGKAIIASNIPGIRDLIRSGKDGVLFNPYKPEELKNALLVFHNYPNVRFQMSQSAREQAKGCDVEKVYGRILESYRILLKNMENKTS